LHITTKYRGTNANTATPVLVDGQNNIIDVSTWQRNLRGENFTDVAGDHILPRIDAPAILVNALSGTQIRLASGQSIALLGKPAGDDSNSWGEPFLLWHNGKEYAKVRSSPGANAVIYLDYNANDATSSSFTAAGGEIMYKGTLDVTFKEIDGVRRAGSKSSSRFFISEEREIVQTTPFHCSLAVASLAQCLILMMVLKMTMAISIHTLTLTDLQVRLVYKM
jgi:hypothetical protein